MKLMCTVRYCIQSPLLRLQHLKVECVMGTLRLVSTSSLVNSEIITVETAWPLMIGVKQKFFIRTVSNKDLTT